MLSLNPFKKPDCRQAGPARIPDDSVRCQRHFANGSRCRNPIAHDSPDLCAFHRDQADQAARRAEAAAVVQELYSGLSGAAAPRAERGPLWGREASIDAADLNSEAAVARVLANLFRLIAEDRIPDRRAALLASTARAILRALKDCRQSGREQSLALAKKSRAESEEEKDRRINAAMGEWSRSLSQPSRSVPPHSEDTETIRTEHPDNASDTNNCGTVAPNFYPEEQSSQGASSAISLRQNLSTQPESLPARVAAGLDPPGFRQSHDHAAPDAFTAAPKDSAPTPKICYTYQEAFAESLRQCRLTNPDLPDYKSEDIAVHNGDVNRKKWKGGPIKFNGMSLRDFLRFRRNR